MRACSRCRKEFERSVFSPDPKTGRLRTSYCPSCRREYERERRAANPERERERQKKWRQKNWDAAKKAQYRWRQKNPEKWKEVNQRWRERYLCEYTAKVRERNRNLVFGHYGTECACCGESQRLFLTIDHIGNDGAEHRREIGNKGGSSFFAWLVAEGFPSGFQTLCRNCNWGKHANGGICPHQVSEGSTTIP